MNVETLIKEQILIVVETLYKRGYPKINVPFSFMRSKSKTIARAFRFEGRLEFNEEYFKQIVPAKIREIVTHEICHLYQYKYFPMAKQAHGVEFRALNRIFGYSGSASIDSGVKVQVARKNKVKRAEYVTTSGKKYLVTLPAHKKAMAYTAAKNKPFFHDKKTGEPASFTGRIVLKG